MKRCLFAFLLSLVIVMNISALALASTNTEATVVPNQSSRPVGRMDWGPQCPPMP